MKSWYDVKMPVPPDWSAEGNEDVKGRYLFRLHLFEKLVHAGLTDEELESCGYAFRVRPGRETMGQSQ